MATERVQWINVPFAVHERPQLKRVLNGIEAYGRQAGWRLRLPYYFPRTPLFDLPGRGSPEMDGQISGVPTRAHLRQIRGRQVPTVLINCGPPVPPWAGNVEFDFAALGRLAFAHFHQQGFRQIAYFGSTHPERANHHRYRQAILQVAAEHGVELACFAEAPPNGNWADYAGQQEQWTRWIRQLPEGAGLICGDDECAARAYLAAERARRTVGGDLFILGRGNEEVLCEAFVPPLSSIQLDYYAMGWEAAGMLDAFMRTGRRPSPSRQIAFASVITRQSSRPQANVDPRVDRALRIIWNRLGEGLSVESVARQVHMDRRHLHRLFLDKLGRSPMAEIQRARVETAKRLLCESPDSMASIAAACGFADQAHMTRSVKAATGSTPSRFRIIGHRG